MTYTIYEKLQIQKTNQELQFYQNHGMEYLKQYFICTVIYFD